VTPASSAIKTFNVDSYYTEYAESVDGAGCSGLSTSGPVCYATVRGKATFTKSIKGVQDFVCGTDAAHALTPDGKLTYTCTGVVFTATLEGCGSGTIIADETGGYIDLAKYNAKTDSAPAFNRWKIRGGSGTGQLQDVVSGSGENHWMEHLKGEVDPMVYSGTGHFTGTISCRI
jgi:hypothetical protein